MKLKYKVGLYSILNLLLIIIISLVIASLFKKTRNDLGSISSINHIMGHLMQDREKLKLLMLTDNQSKANHIINRLIKHNREYNSHKDFLNKKPRIHKLFNKIKNFEDQVISQKKDILKEQKLFNEGCIQESKIRHKIMKLAETSNSPGEMLRFSPLMYQSKQALFQYRSKQHTIEWINYIDKFATETENEKIRLLLNSYKETALTLAGNINQLNKIFELNERTFGQYELLLARLDETISNQKASADNELIYRLNVLRNFGAAASIIYILLTLFFSFILHYYIIKPIHELTSTANTVAQGNFSAKADATGMDEIGELAENFNLMTGSLKELYENMDDKITEKTQELEHTNRKLKEESEQRMALVKMFEMQASTDPLTGCMNRRAAEELLKKEVARAIRHKSMLAICYIDLDNLKTANDTYGHKEGDYMICTFVDRTLKSMRKEDMLCRMGGDEFMMICPDCDIDGVASICHRINHELETENQTNGKGYKIDFSWGALQYDQYQHSAVDKFIDSADQIMYENKMRKKRKQAEAAGKI